MDFIKIHINKLSGNRNIVLINVVVFMMLFYLFRATIPFLKFPFLVIYSALGVYTIINFRSHLASVAREFFRNYYLSLLLALSIIISFFLSNKMYLSIFKDIVNTLILLSLFFIGTVYVKTRSDFKIFVSILLKSMILFGLLISAVLLSYYFNPPAGTGNLIPGGSFSYLALSLSTDFNFALLPVFFGIIAAIYFLSESRTTLVKVILHLSLIVFTITIIFSGSRRGLITLGILLFFLILLQVFLLFRKDSRLLKISYGSGWGIISMVTVILLIAGFIFAVPVPVKRIALKTLGVPVRTYIHTTAARLFKYSTYFSNYDGAVFRHRLWNSVHDPYRPDSGWGLQRGTSDVFPLTGENVEIVPEKAIGYKMGAGCDAGTWGNNAYSFTNISGLFKGNRNSTDKNVLYASVYCFVSEDFDGTWVRISAEGKAAGILKEYDIRKKGTWQKLEISFENDSEIPPVYLYWSKYGVTDFSTLKGYVIFAFPQYGSAETNSNNLTSPGLPVVSGDNKQVMAGLNFSVVPIMEALMSQIPDKDPIRNWAAKLISEDTVYYAPRHELAIDSISNKFVAERIMRWQFAGKIFSTEFNWKQKLFGGGFNYLNWFGYRFLNDKTESDYPHNPFLSILLYSGIAGLTIYLIFMFKVFHYYIRYFYESSILFIFFILAYFFSFFSAGSPFDPPVAGFFVLMSFFIHSIFKNIETGDL